MCIFICVLHTSSFSIICFQDRNKIVHVAVNDMNFDFCYIVFGDTLYCHLVYLLMKSHCDSSTETTGIPYFSEKFGCKTLTLIYSISFDFPVACFKVYRLCHNFVKNGVRELLFMM